MALPACSPPAEGLPNEALPPMTVIPETLSTECRGARPRLYDRCANQADLLAQARVRAERENKIVLVSYGDDWCIWCHVFEKYLKGYSENFAYIYGDPGEPGLYSAVLSEKPVSIEKARSDADELSTFARNNLVLFHLSSDADDAEDVMDSVQAWEGYTSEVPYIFALTREGIYADFINAEAISIRRDGALDWYRGYDRMQLLAELKSLHDKASAPAP